MTLLLYIAIAVAVIASLILIYIIVGLSKAIIHKNKEVKLLKLDDNNTERYNDYGEELFELIKVSSPATSNDESFHIIREKIKEIFPLIHKSFYRKKVGQNVIYTYKNDKSNNPNVLFVSHIDNLSFINDAVMLDEEIYGAGTFDGKALLYVICKAVEEVIAENNQLDVNLTIVITTDDTSTKEGSRQIANLFMREGKFFNLVLEEGIGIVDPDYLGLKSNYALIGVGVTGELEIRFKKPRQDKQILKNFIKDIKTDKIFRTKINSKILYILKKLSKDMDFKDRFYIHNFLLYKRRVQRLLDSGEMKASRIIQTNLKVNDIKDDDNYSFVDIKLELAPLTTPSDALLALTPYIEKYNLEYEILFINEGSKIADIESQGYQSVVQTIKKIFNNQLYVSPFIITNIAEKRFFDSVSDCVIRFSPLYYPSKNLQDIYQGKEHIQKKSLPYGVDFFKKILKDFRWR